VESHDLPTSLDEPVHHARPVGVGSLRLDLRSNDPHVITRFDRLFEALPAPVDGGLVIDAVILSWRPDAGDGPLMYKLDVDGETLGSSAQLSEPELWLTRRLNQSRLDVEPHLLHIHSAALAREGRAVMLVGRSRSGKSTLTARLLQRGWDYLTDEQVALQPSSISIESYPRPITLRHPVWPLFPHVEGVPSIQPDDGRPARIEVAPSALGSVHVAGALEVTLLLAPSYEPDEPLGLLPFETRSHVVEWLSTNCFDLDRVGPDGFAQLVELARRCPAWRLISSDVDQAASLVRKAFESALTAPIVEVRHIPPTLAIEPLAPNGLRRATGAHAWAFADGSCVVYEPSSRTMARLDKAGTQVWEVLANEHQANNVDWSASSGRPDTAGTLDGWLVALVAAGLIETTEKRETPG